MSSQKTMKDDPRIIDVLKDDLRRGDFGTTMKKDYRELKEFMLDVERQKRLTEMGKFKRWFVLSWWLLKSLFFRLTPARRLLVVLACILLLVSNTFRFENENVSVNSNTGLTGGIILVFILMLELKDKLLAKEELEEGHAVQKSLMPERSPQVPGWNLWLFTRSANEVGGDLVDYLKVDDDRHSVALADVAGKGLSAALLTAKLQATIRAVAPDFSSLDELGVKLNHIFHRDSPPNLFASLVFIDFRSQEGTIRVLNAGHFPPVMVHEQQIQPLEKGGAALGIMKDASYTEHVLEMKSGDLLFVYSDGIIEAKNEAGDFWGEQRLFALLPALSRFPVDQIGERLLGDVDRFVGTARAHDDISIAILKKE